MAGQLVYSKTCATLWHKSSNMLKSKHPPLTIGNPIIYPTEQTVVISLRAPGIPPWKNWWKTSYFQLLSHPLF